MLTRADIIDPGRRHEFTVCSSGMDRKNSVSSSVVRCVINGQRAVAVGSDASAKTQIAALLDLLHLRNAHAQVTAHITNDDEVTVILGDAKDEAIDALRTLRGSLVTGPAINILVSEHDGSLRPIDPEHVHFADADTLGYRSWSGLLKTVTQPPDLVNTIARAVDAPEFRVYPMLTSPGWWSMRMEGLEVGRAQQDGGWLDVGKDGINGAQSEPRRVWQQATRLRDRHSVQVHDQASIVSGAQLLRRFAREWFRPGHSRQNEHALESRVLRGAVPLRTSEGAGLELIRGHDPLVNWGSQFPTKWGRGGQARYLDALLRDGTTPWAVEMKVAGGAGVGVYYRHAIAQALLYREFIRGATPLHWWFARQGLQAGDCRGAVVVPELAGAAAPWRPGLAQLCDDFGVDLIEVPAASAILR